MAFFPAWVLDRVAYWMMFALIVLSIERLKEHELEEI